MIILNDTNAQRLHGRASCYQFLHLKKKSFEKRGYFHIKAVDCYIWATNLGKPLIKKNTQTFPIMRGRERKLRDRVTD